MKILTTQKLTVRKTVYTADYIDGYNDGMPLSSQTLTFDSPEERLADLKANKFSDDEIDIDTDTGDNGWEFGQHTSEFKITVEVVQRKDGKIIVRQKQ